MLFKTLLNCSFCPFAGQAWHKKASVPWSAAKNKESFLFPVDESVVNVWSTAAFSYPMFKDVCMVVPLWRLPCKKTVDNSEFLMNCVLNRRMVLLAPNLARTCVVRASCGFDICKTEIGCCCRRNNIPDIDFDSLEKKRGLFLLPDQPDVLLSVQTLRCFVALLSASPNGPNPIKTFDLTVDHCF